MKKGLVFFILCNYLPVITVLELVGLDFHQKIFVGFNEGMSPYREYSDVFLKRKDWQLIKFLYDKNLIENFNYNEQPRIPKIIHQIWLGGPLPERCRMLQKTWIDHHPDWEYRLWTEKEIANFGLVNKNLFDTTNNFGAKADIARYEILYRVGGLYIDTDFECLRSFDVINHCCDFYTGIGFSNDVVLFNGLIGSAPGNIILKECFMTIKQGKKNESSDEIMQRTGPYHFTRCFFRKVSEFAGVAIAFPLTYFYPWPAWLRHDKDVEKIRDWVKPESFAIHHWHVAWAK